MLCVLGSPVLYPVRRQRAVDLESSVGDVRHHGVIHLQQTVVDARSVAAELQIVKRSLRPDFSGNAAVDFGEHTFQQALEPGDVLPVVWQAYWW